MGWRCGSCRWGDERIDVLVCAFEASVGVPPYVDK
jgi:hypothetical protein